MRRETRVLIYCLLFLGVAECAVRLLEAVLLPGQASTDQLAVFLLGSSRTMRGLRPVEVERELARRGVPNASVVNVSDLALKNVGLHEFYMRRIHPLAKNASPGGIVAVEVRGAAMNDSATTQDELDYVRGHDLVPESRLQADEHPSLMGLLAEMGLPDLRSVSRTLVNGFHLSRGRRTVMRAASQWFASNSQQPAAGPGNPPTTGPTSRPEKGWEPLMRPLRADLEAAMWKKRYQELLLKDYRLGGVQTEVLVRLIRQIRSDGFEVVLFIMPTTDIYKSFFAPGQYQAFLAHLRGLAARESAPLVDLDATTDLPRRDFHDVHHLFRSAVDKFSRIFTRQVLLPLLPGGESGAGAGRPQM